MPKITITIEVDVNDPELDWDKSTVDGWSEDGQRFWDVEAIATYNGHPVEDMDYDKAEDYLIEREIDKAHDHGKTVSQWLRSA